MSDHLDRKVTRLALADVAGCQRFRIETRIVDSETQQVTRHDFREGGAGPGSIFFAFKTNVMLSQDERRQLVQQIADLLIEARIASGDE